jgi:hypothetical protein
VPPGIYTVELVGPSGTVVTSTAAFSAAAGDVIQISQTIPIAQAQRLARAVYTSTWAAITAAASSGVLAIGPGAYVTPGR